MQISRNVKRIVGVGALALAMVALPSRAWAHCDTMDGPVVKAAEQALATKQLEPMLIWVRAQDESEIRHAFEHTLKVRSLGGDAAKLADRFFFETVVRIHREGEGEPYTGLKPAGTDLGHAVPAADRVLESGCGGGARALSGEGHRGQVTGYREGGLAMNTTTQSTANTVLRSDELSCPSCVAKIEKSLRALEGVEEAKVRFAAGRIEVRHDPELASTDALVEAVRRAGYTARPSAF